MQRSSGIAALAFAAVMLSVGCAAIGLAPRRPAFTGTWVLNLARSKLQVPPPDSTIFVIDHHEPVVRIFRTHARAGRLDTVTITLRTDSSRIDGELRGAKSVSRSWWSGKELKFSLELTRGEQSASQIVTYSLSDDRSTFTAVEDVNAGANSHLNRWVFDRRR
jgi:hypothetical protein